MRFDDAILVAAKIKTLASNVNQEQAHTGNLEGQISKNILHQVTRHAGQQLMTDTVKYYGVQVTGVKPKCISCSLEKIRQKNIPKKNEKTNRKKSKALNRVAKCHTMLVQDSFLGYLLVLTVELWKGIAG